MTRDGYFKHSLSAGPCLFLFSFIFGFFSFTSCNTNDSGKETLFEALPPQTTGITFVNRLEEKPGNNILETEFFYNGGGVAIGDIDQNGLPDIYFTANQGSNALYLNQGNYKFQNITSAAGVEDSTGWSAGTAMADVNGDGLLDIYICKAGETEPENRRNKLFINNGDQTFSERAAEYGLDDPGYCTQPLFFDSNGNGLLDLFIVNYNTRTFTNFDILTIRDQVDTNAGDKLYRNNGDNTFTDVSEEAGIHQNPLGFGLSATVSDLNRDGYPDIYVANDFMERDYMYMNNGDGTFSDEILNRTIVTSHFSMGSDIADMNNDGHPDILVADMLPPDYSRRRVFKHPDPNIYDQLAANGYHRKNMRNTLQVNHGDGTFTEAGQLAGISMSDWSWSILAADFTNSGRNDIHITNGFPRFYTDLDYLNDILWKQYPDEDLPDDPDLRYELVRQMDQVEMHNHAFQNNGNVSFSESTRDWGLERSSVSGGAAYADLNGNGSLDLIVNNINEPPFIYKNNAAALFDHNWLKIELKGSGKNTYATGASVQLTTDDGTLFFREAYPVRGFQSSVDPVLHFGLGSYDMVSLEVTWPDQSMQKIDSVSANQTLTIVQDSANQMDHRQEGYSGYTMFTELDPAAIGVDFSHESGLKRDRIRTPLMPYTLTNLGPALTYGDINNDGLEDLFIGGGVDQPGALYLQLSGGTFNKIETPVFEEHASYDDIDALFFDSNGNGHLDLYVVSGGNFDPLNGEKYQDRLYVNDGFGNFRWNRRALPEMHSSGGVVEIVDINEDGNPDLFVGGRTLTGRYPMPPRSYLLENRDGTFTDVTEDVTPELMRPGMVADAVWANLDDEDGKELAIAGEWMPVRVFKKSGPRTFREYTSDAGLDKTAGWWNVLKAADMNGDGALDLVGGNWGLNSGYRATANEPMIVYVDDFNENSFHEPIITQIFDGQRYPVPGRDLLLKQMPELEDTFPDYSTYSTATIRDILTDQQIRNAESFELHMLHSAIFENTGTGTFNITPLPHEAQVAPVYDIFIDDFYQNGTPDLLMAGNNYGTMPQTGPVATVGVLLKGEPDSPGFRSMLPSKTGLYARGDIRRIALMPTTNGPLFILAGNDQAVIPYLYRYQPE